MPDPVTEEPEPEHANDPELISELTDKYKGRSDYQDIVQEAWIAALEWVHGQPKRRWIRSRIEEFLTGCRRESAANHKHDVQSGGTFLLTPVFEEGDVPDIVDTRSHEGEEREEDPEIPQAARGYAKKFRRRFTINDFSRFSLDERHALVAVEVFNYKDAGGLTASEIETRLLLRHGTNVSHVDRILRKLVHLGLIKPIRTHRRNVITGRKQRQYIAVGTESGASGGRRFCSKKERECPIQ